jgi:hypothetical protein
MQMIPILSILAIVVISFIVVALFSAPAWMASQDRKRATVVYGLLVPLFGLFFFNIVSGVFVLLLTYQNDRLVTALVTAATLFPCAYAFRWLVVRTKQRLHV